MRKCLVFALSALLLAGCASGEVPSASSSGAGSPAASSPAPSSSSAAPASPQVRVDWSRRESSQRPIQPDVDGGQWFPEYTDRLRPGEDYGPLLPYLGGLAYSFQRREAGGETQEYWNDWASSFYGLMTREGKIVVDPVYQYVYPYSYQWRGEDISLPVLILSLADPQWRDSGGRRYAAAAEDGSWVTDFEFLQYTNRGDQLFLLRPEGGTLLDSKTGARRDWSWAELGIEAVEDSLNLVQWNIGLSWTDHGVCVGCCPAGEWDQMDDIDLRVLDPETGETFWVKNDQWLQWSGEHAGLGWGEPENVVHRDGGLELTIDGQTYFLPRTARDCYLYMRWGDFAVLDEQQAGNRFFSLYRLSTGEMLMEAQMFLLVQDRYDSGRILPAAQVDGVWTVYSGDLEPLFSLPYVSEEEWVEFSLRGSLLSFQYADCFGCYDLDAERYIFYRNLGLGD